MTLQSLNIYIFDTSSLIKLKDYPTDLFIGLRERVESLILQGRIIAPKQVFDEINRQDDEIKVFVERNKNTMLVDTNSEEIMREVSCIVKKIP